MSDTPSDKIEQLPEPDESDSDGIESIKDPGEYALRRRLTQILDARERVVQARNEADEKFEDLRHTEKRQYFKHEHIAKAVHEYAVEVEALIEQQDELDTEWPDSSVWKDLQHYINEMGHVPGDCPVAITGFHDEDPDKLFPPASRYSLMTYRYLNRVLANMGLDAQLDSGRDMSRY